MLMLCVKYTKSHSVLPVQDYNAKLSDFGLARTGPSGDQTHVSTRVMGTYGYAAPEYVMTGEPILFQKETSLNIYGSRNRYILHFTQKLCVLIQAFIWLQAI